MLAFPRTSRADHAADLLTVLEQVDGEHGSPSWREGAALVTVGLGLRADRVANRLTPTRLLVAAGLMCAIGALAPGSAWGLRTPGPGRYYVVAGPTPTLRWALLCAAALAVTSAVAHRGVRSLVATSLAAGSGGLVLALSTTLRPSAPHDTRVGIAQAFEHALLRGAAISVAGLLASLALVRVSRRYRVGWTAASVALVCIAAVARTLQGDPHAGPGGAAVTLAPWQLGPAGLLVAATAVLGGLVVLARRQVDREAGSSDRGR